MVEILAIIRPNRLNDTKRKLIEANSYGQPGDGKIFVCPIEKSYRVRTRKMAEDI